MASESLVARLEAVCGRLEKAASRVGRGGGGGGGDDDDDVEVPIHVEEWNQFIAANQQPLLDAYTAAGCGAQVPVLESGLKKITAYVQATGECKKPSNQESMAFLKDAVDAIGAAEKLGYKRYKRKEFDYGNHNLGFKEVVNGAMQWVLMVAPNLPGPFVKNQLDSALFRLNKVLMAAKNMEDPDKTNHRNYVNLTKKFMNELAAYIKANCKTGLEWKVGGKDLASFTGGSTPAAKPAAEEKAPEPEPAKPAAKKKKIAGGLANVFAQMKKGGDAMGEKGSATSAFALKKVKRSDMSHKRRADGLEGFSGPIKAAPKKAAKKKTAKKPKKVRPSSTSLRGGRWTVENYRDNAMAKLEAEKVKVKHNVFIVGCEGAGIHIPVKCKAIAIDSCKKCKIWVSDVVSTVEMTNSKSCQIIVMGAVPAIQVDKCSSARIRLAKEAFVDKVNNGRGPDIITSNIDAMNIEFPDFNGEKDKDGNDPDPIEMPIPEQFITRIDPKSQTIKTEEVVHG